MTGYIIGCPKTKKALKTMINQRVDVVVPTPMGSTHYPNFKGAIVGPEPYIRNWFAEITVKDGILLKVT